jgi:hypothetical protein
MLKFDRDLALMLLLPPLLLVGIYVNVLHNSIHWFKPPSSSNTDGIQPPAHQGQ